MEPGVYLLQISGTVASASATVKLVSDQLEADLVSLSSPSSQLAFRLVIIILVLSNLDVHFMPSTAQWRSKYKKRPDSDKSDFFSKTSK